MDFIGWLEMSFSTLLRHISTRDCQREYACMLILGDGYKHVL
jgi:hypothetical protein